MSGHGAGRRQRRRRRAAACRTDGHSFREVMQRDRNDEQHEAAEALRSPPLSRQGEQHIHRPPPADAWPGSPSAVLGSREFCSAMRLCCRRRLLCRGRAPRADPAAGAGTAEEVCERGRAQLFGLRIARIRACSRCSSRSVAWRRRRPRGSRGRPGVMSGRPTLVLGELERRREERPVRGGARRAPTAEHEVEDAAYCSFSPSMLMMTAAEPSAVMNQPNDAEQREQHRGHGPRSTSDAGSHEAAPPRRRSGPARVARPRRSRRAAARRRRRSTAWPPVAEWTPSARKRRSRDLSSCAEAKGGCTLTAPAPLPQQPARRGARRRSACCSSCRRTCWPRSVPAAARPRHRARDCRRTLATLRLALKLRRSAGGGDAGHRRGDAWPPCRDGRIAHARDRR